MAGDHANHHNDLADAIMATQAELGTNPSGASADVAARFTADETLITTAQATADAAIPETLLDAKGDLIVASAADTAARLGVGTDGHVLTLDSAQSLGVKWAAAPGAGSGTTEQVADYIVWKNGANYQADTPTGKTAVTAGTDPGLVLQSCITNLGSAGGTIVIAPNTNLAYTSTVPALPVNLTGWLRILGSGGTTITLASGAPRAFDIGRTADNQWLRYIELGGFDVDANSTTGYHHVLVGNYVAASSTTGQNLNGRNIYIHDINFHNVVAENATGAGGSPPTTHRLCIYFGPTTTAANTVLWEKCVVERVHINPRKDAALGGNYGVAFVQVAGTAGTAVFDQLMIRDCSHYRGLQPGSTFITSTTSFFYANTGKVTNSMMVNCWGMGSGDDGFEIDNPQNVTLINCHYEDCFTQGFVISRLQNGTDPKDISISLINCSYKRTSSSVVQGNAGFWIGTASVSDSKNFGYASLRDCTVTYDNIQAVDTQIHAGFQFDSPLFVVLDGCKFELINYAHGATATNGQPGILGFYFHTATLSCKTKITMRDCRAHFYGTTGGANVFAAGLLLSGTEPNYTIDNFRDEYQITGGTSNMYRSMYLPYSSLGGTTPIYHRGVVRNSGPLSAHSDTNPIWASINEGGSASTVADSNSKIVFENNDLKYGVSGREIFIGLAAAKPFVFATGTRWVTWPRTTSTSVSANFSSGSFTTATANTYIGLAPADLFFVQGSGAGITLIEVSRDNGTTFDTVLTQASAAIPASQPVQVAVEPGDQVRITFATTAPSIKVRYRKS